MANTCLSTLKVYGQKHLAERACSMIKPIFGPCLPAYNNPFLKEEPNNPPLGVVRIESREVPPVSLVAEMSEREPDLVFELIYSNWARSVRGSRVYRGGKVTRETQEDWHPEAELATDSTADAALEPMDSGAAAPKEEEADQSMFEGGETPAAQVNGGVTYGHRNYLQYCLDRIYALERKQLVDGRALTPEEEAEQKECSESLITLEPKLNNDDSFYVKQLHEQYRLGLVRDQLQCRLHGDLDQCLKILDYPWVVDLLDVEDRETVQRMSCVLEKVRVR
jgi:hypothetical protein